MRWIRKYLYDFFCLLFPDLCNACEKPLYQGEDKLCTTCIYDLPFTDFHIYPQNKVAKLFWGRLNCDAAMAMLYFRKGGKVQQLIHQLKYKNKPDLGFRLGAILGERIAHVESYKEVDLILPVPLHMSRKHIRGYNQSEMIANGIGSFLNVAVSSTLLLRSRATGTQTKKSRYKRFENMRQVFYAPDPGSLTGKCVMLVDDVITTGSTLEACGQVLIDCGIKKLYIVTLAYSE